MKDKIALSLGLIASALAGITVYYFLYPAADGYGFGMITVSFPLFILSLARYVSRFARRNLIYSLDVLLWVGTFALMLTDVLRGMHFSEYFELIFCLSFTFVPLALLLYLLIALKRKETRVSG